MTGAGANSVRIAHNMQKSMRLLMIRAFPPGAYRKKLIDLFFEKLNSKMNVQFFDNQIIPIYARNFTDDDIKGLIRFYQTPLGQKYVELRPKMEAEVQAVVKVWGPKLGRECMEEVFAEHPELAQELRDAQKTAQSH